MPRLWTATFIAAALGPLGAQETLATQRLVDVRQIASDTLRDVAVATFVQGRPTIYYNPVLMQGFGPRMADFFFAHEYGHIRYGHTGGALSHEGEANVLRQRQELEADCYAAEVLGDHHRESVEAAVRFFQRMGPYRYDVLHPTGSQRAAKILACLPPLPELPAQPVAGAGPGADGQVSFTLRSPAASAGEYAMDAVIAIDDCVVGTVSSIRQPGSVQVRGLPAGAHRYKVTVRLYAFDAMLQLNPSGTAIGEGLIVVEEGSVLAVHWRQGQPPMLVRQ